MPSRKLPLEQQLETLRLFNDKVSELADSSFIKGLINPETGFRINGQRQDDGTFKVSVSSTGPTPEAVRAFVLTFRFFIQDNEKTSLSNMASLYDSPNIDPQQRAFFQSAFTEVNRMLDSTNLLNFNFNGVAPTNRQVLNIFVYGFLAHANADKYAQYQEWMSVPLAEVALKSCFNLILGKVLEALTYAREVNKNTLRQLAGPV
jgi:hypothetical protein